MGDISKFSIIIYERKPGHWRAAVIPKGSGDGPGAIWCVAS
jgi:hypothetical protein